MIEIERESDGFERGSLLGFDGTDPIESHLFLMA